MQQCHRHTLPNRQVSKGATGPLGSGGQQTFRFAGQLNTGRLTHTELLQHIGETIFTHALRQHQRPHVGGLTKHTRCGVSDGAVLPRILDRHPGHVDAARNLQYFIRLGHAVFNSRRSSNHLGYRAGLKRRGHGRVIKVFSLIQLACDVTVGIDGAGVGHRQHLARLRIQHHRRRPLSLRLCLRLLQLLLDVGLQIQIQGQLHIRAIDHGNLVALGSRNGLATGGHI